MDETQILSGDLSEALSLVKFQRLGLEVCHVMPEVVSETLKDCRAVNLKKLQDDILFFCLNKLILAFPFIDLLKNKI